MRPEIGIEMRTIASVTFLSFPPAGRSKATAAQIDTLLPSKQFP